MRERARTAARRSAAAAVAAVVALVAVPACTTGDDPRSQKLAARPTTTLALSDAEGAELPPPLPGTPPEEIRAALDAAVEARDPCALAAAIDEGIPDTSDPAAVLAAYRALLDAVRRAEAFRPQALADAWVELEDGVAAGVDALEAAGGNLDDEAVAATFTADSLQGAVRLVQRWAELRCPAP